MSSIGDWEWLTSHSHKGTSFRALGMGRDGHSRFKPKMVPGNVSEICRTHLCIFFFSWKKIIIFKKQPRGIGTKAKDKVAGLQQRSVAKRYQRGAGGGGREQGNPKFVALKWLHFRKRNELRGSFIKDGERIILSVMVESSSSETTTVPTRYPIQVQILGAVLEIWPSLHAHHPG